MKRFSLAILLLLVFNQISNAQSKTKYNLYLVFNSENNEMHVIDKNVNDSVLIKTFKLSKDLASENFKYELLVGDDGEIDRNLEKVPVAKKGKITLYHFSYMHGEESLDNLSDGNIINYEDFINSEFKSFSKILNSASKIYMVDLKDKDQSIYRAYEVKL
ncbi:hypothetical protein [Winogradskyella ouciana]|uniref:Uncharacterized protein n=1 Tax=Winogradskyella ouciana TaxID=2608631 RepID=A0A7K1GAX6_9FLAO|nr:hypothetical protein [Winogradskyella ouciana]MTE26303.1 hypothetical protein [Winogradskyella ouciana]